MKTALGFNKKKPHPTKSPDRDRRGLGAFYDIITDESNTKELNRDEDNPAFRGPGRRPFRFGDHRLGLSLTTRNVGDTTFRYREGYHPYFAVSDCYKLTLAGVDGCRYESDRDLPCDVTHIWQGGPVPEWPGCDLFRFGQERSVLTLTDPVWKREIVLSTTGGRDVVTWCQDVKGASKGTMNIRPEECRNYFCIEPSNFYRESEIALESGESHTFETVISVRPIK